MHARIAAVAVLLSLAPALLIAPVARAQSTADDETTKAARSRFQEGVDFYDKGQYEKARAAFLQAYALRKHPAVLVNLAQSCLKSSHQLEAVRYFQQYLRESTSLTAAQRADAEKGINEARAKLGRLEISAPTGAEISVDNTTVGSAPLSEPVDVEPGSHAVRMKAADGTLDTKNVATSAGEKVKVQFTATQSPAPVVAPVPVTAPATATPANPPPSSPPTPSGAPADASGTASAGAGADSGSGNTNLFARPKTLVPVIIGAGLVVVGVTTAIVLSISKNTALDNGRKVASDILNAKGTPDTCSANPVAQRFQSACATLQNNVDTANTDNTIANVGIGVAIGGAALAVGWYLFAPKRADESASRPPDVTLAPVFGGRREGNGFAVVKSF